MALSTAQKVGFPRDKMVGNWWAGSEIDTEAAGPRRMPPCRRGPGILCHDGRRKP